jgi:hypothetical protein
MEEEEDQEEVYVNLGKVRIFLTTDPFLVLVERMQQKLHPSLTIPPLPPPNSPNYGQSKGTKGMVWCSRQRKHGRGKSYN